MMLFFDSTLFFLSVSCPIKYTDSQNNFVTRTESPNNELIRTTDNKEDWRAMIAEVCNITDT